MHMKVIIQCMHAAKLGLLHWTNVAAQYFWMDVFLWF